MSTSGWADREQDAGRAIEAAEAFAARLDCRAMYADAGVIRALIRHLDEEARARRSLAGEDVDAASAQPGTLFPEDGAEAQPPKAGGAKRGRPRKERPPAADALGESASVSSASSTAPSAEAPTAPAAVVGAVPAATVSA